MVETRYFFDSSTTSFFVEGVNKIMPSTAVEISEDLYKEIFEGQSRGKIIDVDGNGLPCLKEREISEELKAQLDLKRQIVLLEKEITPRRLREAVLGTDNNWLALQDEKIKTLRQSLIKVSV
jgi:hypothetical protein